MSCARVVCCLALILLLGGLLHTQEAGPRKNPFLKKPAPAAAKPAAYKVEKKPFRVELTVKGILEPGATAAISYRPQLMVQPVPGQNLLTISKIVDHGAAVKKGDVLAVFDTTKLDEVIADAETEKKTLEASIKLAEAELPTAQKSAPVELAAAETAKKRADEDLKYWVEVGRPHTEKDEEFVLKAARFYLESAQEELRQLQKMYKANDLTEDTEKIVLRRQQFWVDMAVFFYQEALIRHDRTMKYTLPNRDKDLRDNQARQSLLLEKARLTLTPALLQKEQALARMRFEHAKHQVRLEKLHRDRAAMTITAPQDGIAYRGRFHNGHWTVSDALVDKLVPGGSVTPDEVFLTVVKPRPLVVHLTVEEKDAHLVKPGLAGKASVLFHPHRKLPARVTRLSPVPAAPGKFDAQVALDLGPADVALVPGMACSVRFVPYAKADALAVPSKAVHEEDDRYVVHVVGPDGKPETRAVTPGQTNSTHTEILAGLRAGEEVLLDRPTDTASMAPGSTTPQKGAAP